MENQFVVSLKVDELKEIINNCVSDAISHIPVPKVEDCTLFRRKDVAALFKVSLVTITQWMKSGKLPYHRINSRIFFKKEEVMQAMETSPKYKRELPI